jgi:hypothetical protein
MRCNPRRVWRLAQVLACLRRHGAALRVCAVHDRLGDVDLRLLRVDQWSSLFVRLFCNNPVTRTCVVCSQSKGPW